MKMKLKVIETFVSLIFTTIPDDDAVPFQINAYEKKCSKFNFCWPICFYIIAYCCVSSPKKAFCLALIVILILSGKRRDLILIVLHLCLIPVAAPRDGDDKDGQSFPIIPCSAASRRKAIPSVWNYEHF